MARVGLMVFLLLVAGCSAGAGSESSADDPSETPEASEEPRDLNVERVSSGAPGQGPRRPRVRRQGVPGWGGVPPRAAQGEKKPAGCFSVAGDPARLEGNTVTVRLSL